MRDSMDSWGAPPRVSITEVHETMHFSWPMSTPYLYHLAASTRSGVILLIPYS